MTPDANAGKCGEEITRHAYVSYVMKHRARGRSAGRGRRLCGQPRGAKRRGRYSQSTHEGNRNELHRRRRENENENEKKRESGGHSLRCHFLGFRFNASFFPSACPLPLALELPLAFALVLAGTSSGGTSFRWTEYVCLTYKSRSPSRRTSFSRDLLVARSSPERGRSRRREREEERGES